MAKKGPPEFNDLLEAARIAARLIPEHHAHLSDVRIRWVLSTEDAGEKSCERYARIVLRKPLERWLGLADGGNWGREGTDAVAIVFPSEVWANLNGLEKDALMDHLLSHLDVDPDTGKLSKGPHDVSEFVAVRKRHGDWHPGLKRFARALQPPLPLDAGPATAEPEREAVGAGV